MPISMPFQTTRISQDEFGDIAFEVLSEVFAIHNEFGRFLDEKFYKREIASRMNEVQLEVPITVSFRGFTKQYFLDMLKGFGGLFELKSVDSIHPRHRGQTVNYLLLADLEHAKIINVRPEKVEHEFVNCHDRLRHLRSPLYHFNCWNKEIPGTTDLLEIIRLLITDWGTGLDFELYNSALSYFLGGEEAVPIIGSSGELGVQKLRMAAGDVAFKVTTIHNGHESFETHARRLLNHTPLRAILWTNITRNDVSFQVIQR